MSPLQEESGCEDDEGEDEEEGREEDEFDSDESLVDSDSDSDEKGVFLTAAAGSYVFMLLFYVFYFSFYNQILKFDTRLTSIRIKPKLDFNLQT